MINVLVNDITPEMQQRLNRLRADLRGRPAARVVAEAAADLTRDHLGRLARTRHRGHSTHNFYGRAADSVIGSAVAGGALVSIPHEGMALRYHGGTVRPSGRVSSVTGRPIRRLAVPIPGKGAEGKTPGEFDGLFSIRSRRGNMLLAGKGPGGMVRLLFMLLFKTVHKPDPSVLPKDSDYLDAAGVFASITTSGMPFTSKTRSARFSVAPAR